MTKVISIINQKGGVGKTTSTVNLGYALASSGKKILVIDLDPQGNASTGLGIDIDKREKTIYEFLVNRNSDPNDFAINTLNENLDIICANVELSGFETEVASESKRAFYLKDVIQQIKQKSQYNQILIDCPPSLNMLTVNALVASDSVLIPMQCEYYALEGLSALSNTILNISKQINPKLRIEGILRTMYDPRSSLTNAVSAQLRKYFGDKIYRVSIPRNVRLAEAPSHGVPIHLHDPSSAGGKDYQAITTELQRRWGLS